MALPAGLRALGHRDFRLFWCGQLVSLIGTWMQSVGQAWLVLELTNSPFRLGVIGALQFGPILLFSFLSGAISDRVRKRRLLLGTQAALMLQAFTLAALVGSGHVQFWHVAVLAALYGLATTLDMPSRQSFIAHLVPRGDLMNAIALNSAVFNGARVVGPAVAGLLVARYGTAAAFLMNGASFIAVLAALAAIRTEGAPSPRRGVGLRAEIAEGVRYAAGTPRVALVMSLLVVVSLFVVNMNVLVPLIARDVLHEGAHGFGLLMAALGVGAVAGALAVAALSVGRPPLGMVVGPALAAAALLLLLSTARHFGPTAAVLVALGFAQIVFMTSCNTTVQIAVPDELRGRVMGLYALVFAGMTPIGALIMGTVAEHWGVSRACAVGGGAGLLLILALTVAWRRRHPAPATPPPSSTPAAP
ncbi:MAG TPA: MFS transporter [Candidatus Acidoferrum sp.]|jgi:predicted MFS family arabinose efflux permease|nr:MFS transporter [Candidatus Acidoferrum sp.]